MTMQLTEDSVDQVLDALATKVWRSPKGALLVQKGAESIELFASPSLRATVSSTLLATTRFEQVNGWVETLAKSPSLAFVLVTEQNLYGSLCEMADTHAWSPRLKRIARHGDCQAGSNFGTETEELYAKEILSAHQQAGVRTVSLERVIGTQLVLMQGNFLFNEEDFFTSTLKSCRPMEEMAKLLQQLYFDKDLRAAVSTDPELSRWFRGQGGVVDRIWRVVPRTDSAAANERATVAANFARYAARSSSREESALSWLDAARKAIGLPTEGAGASDKEPGRSRQAHIVAFLDARRAGSSQAHEAVLASLDSCSDPAPTGQEIVDAARAIALSALGRTPSPAAFELVLQPHTKDQLWWEDATKALIRSWLRTGKPADWFARAWPIASNLIVDTGMEADELYDAVRAALAANSPAALVDFLPFETRDAAAGANNYLKQMREVLGTTHRLSSFADAANLSELAYWQCYEEIRDKCPKPLQHALLRKWRDKWGETSRYFQAATSTDWLDVPVEQTLEMCKEWRTLFPQEGSAWRFTGRVLASEGRTEEALKVFEQALQLDPEDTESHRRKARCLWVLDRDDEAIESLDMLLAKGDDAAASVLLGRIHSFAERDARACEIFGCIKDEDIVANEGAFAYLRSLARSSDWGACRDRFLNWAPHLDAVEHSRVLELAATRLFDNGGGGEAESLIPLIQWNAEVWRCLSSICNALAAAGATDRAFTLWEDARARLLDSADVYYHFAYFCRYCPTPDPERALLVAHEGMQRFPDDDWLPVAAAMAALAAGADPAPIFASRIERLKATAQTEQTTAAAYLLACALWFTGHHREAKQALETYMDLKTEVLGDTHLFHALAALVVGTDADASYAEAVKALSTESEPSRRDSWRAHLLDLECYRRRGWIPDNSRALASANRWMNLS